MTLKKELSEWFDRGVAQGASHMIVVCDTYDHEDYPVYVMDPLDVVKKQKEYEVMPMQRVMEIYSLRKDKQEQMSETRSFHLD